MDTEDEKDVLEQKPADTQGTGWEADGVFYKTEYDDEKK